MSARVGTLLLVTALWLNLPTQAVAQTWTTVSDRPALGLSVGRASSVDQGIGGAWNATLELPTLPTWRVRVDVGRVHWRFDEDMSGRGFPLRTKMTRASATIVRTKPPVGAAVNGYIGGGVGLYWFPAPDEQGFRGWGAHTLGGIEVWLPSERAKIVGELRVDLVGATRPGKPSVSPLQGSAVLGVRWSWKK
jgi:hypothetical protein